MGAVSQVEANTCPWVVAIDPTHHPAKRPQLCSFFPPNFTSNFSIITIKLDGRVQQRIHVSAVLQCGDGRAEAPN